MATITILISIIALIATTNAAALSRKDRIKSLFDTPPEFSHGRDTFVPQNIDVVVDPDTAASVSQGLARDQSAAFINTNHVVNPGMGVPVRIPAMTSQGGISQIKAETPSSIGQAVKARNAASRPIASPVKIGRPKQDTPVANDRMVDSMFQNEVPLKRNPVRASQMKGCDFNIPSFLLPDMSVSQREFERMYLLPALRAHLTAKSCRSRALTVYIDWLLYLRLRNFSV